MLLHASRVAAFLTKQGNLVASVAKGVGRLGSSAIKGVASVPLKTHLNLATGGLAAGMAGAGIASSLSKSREGLEPGYAQATQYPGVPTIPR